ITPFLLAGAGVDFQADYPAQVSRLAPMMTFGGGVRFAMGARSAFFVETRGHFILRSVTTRDVPVLAGFRLGLLRNARQCSSKIRGRCALIGLESEEDWFDNRLEHHPEFLRRVAEARAALREGRRPGRHPISDPMGSQTTWTSRT